MKIFTAKKSKKALEGRKYSSEIRGNLESENLSHKSHVDPIRS